MFLTTNPRRLISEAAAADLLNPEVSEEVKDVVEELEDDLKDIDTVPDDQKTTNGGIPVTTEGVSLMKTNNGRYLVTLEDVIAVMETEGADAAEEAKQNAEPGETPPTAEECEPSATDTLEKIANANGVDVEDVTVVINSNEMACVAEAALLEAGKGRCKGRNTKKLMKKKKVVDALKGKVDLAKA